MRILYYHNYYQHRGGEDVSFDLDVAMLTDFGHDVRVVTRHNDAIRGEHPMSAALSAIWSRSAYREALAEMRDFRPDVVHCNNLFPQFSVSVLSAARKARIPSVQALRNYRSFCANSFFYRNGQVCEQCQHWLVPAPALLHACYRSSRSATSVVVATQTVQRSLRYLGSLPDAYVTPSEFARQTHVRGGFPADRVHVRTNFIHPDPGAGCGSGGFGLFVGRLSPEKGVQTLLEAWRGLQTTQRLLIVGSGPLEQEMRGRAADVPNVELIGERDLQGTLELMGQAAFLIIPSQWYETFGRTIAESFSRGTPVIASRLGAMAELVQHGENGLLFRPGDADELGHRITQLTANEGDYRAMRVAARQTFIDRFTRSESYRVLCNIYRRVNPFVRIPLTAHGESCERTSVA